MTKGEGLMDGSRDNPLSRALCRFHSTLRLSLCLLLDYLFLTEVAAAAAPATTTVATSVVNRTTKSVALSANNLAIVQCPIVRINLTGVLIDYLSRVVCTGPESNGASNCAGYPSIGTDPNAAADLSTGYLASDGHYRKASCQTDDSTLPGIPEILYLHDCLLTFCEATK